MTKQISEIQIRNIVHDCQPTKSTYTFTELLQFYTKLFDFCSARLTAVEALLHPWLLLSAVHSELELSKTKLKRYVIKKRWIKAVNTIIALKRMGAKIDADLL